MNTFRKGGKRIHNYGFFGDLSQQVLEDKLKRDRQVTEESDFKRQDFIRRNDSDSVEKKPQVPVHNILVHEPAVSDLTNSALVSRKGSVDNLN